MGISARMAFGGNPYNPLFCGPDRNRTCDLLHAMQAL